MHRIAREQQHVRPGRKGLGKKNALNVRIPGLGYMVVNTELGAGVDEDHGAHELGVDRRGYGWLLTFLGDILTIPQILVLLLGPLLLDR